MLTQGQGAACSAARAAPPNGTGREEAARSRQGLHWEDHPPSAPQDLPMPGSCPGWADLHAAIIIIIIIMTRLSKPQ